MDSSKDIFIYYELQSILSLDSISANWYLDSKEQDIDLRVWYCMLYDQHRKNLSVKMYSVCNVFIEKLPPQMPRLQQILIE